MLPQQASSRKDPDSEREVFRSAGSAVLSWAWFVVAVIILVDLAVQGRDHAALVTAMLVLGITGVVYACAWRPKIVADSTDALALLIAEESGSPPGDIEPWVVANALMGAHRAVVSHVRSEVLGGRRGPALAAESRSQIERVFATLERGLEHYGIKQD